MLQTTAVGFSEKPLVASQRATRYSCPGRVAAVLTPPVGPVATAARVDFAGSGFVPVSTALLAKRSCTGLAVSAATGVATTSACGRTSATASVVTRLGTRRDEDDNSRRLST